MAQYTVRHGQRYRCTISLGGLQSYASNATIADKLTEAGFKDVVVTGAGYDRSADGTWAGDTVSAEIPDQITAVTMIENPKTVPPPQQAKKSWWRRLFMG